MKFELVGSIANVEAMAAGPGIRVRSYLRKAYGQARFAVPVMAGQPREKLIRRLRRLRRLKGLERDLGVPGDGDTCGDGSAPERRHLT